MFIADREAKCSRPRWSLAGHEVFSQRQTASSSARWSAAPHRGHSVGICHGSESGGRRLRIGPTTRGMTSPAFSTRTQSRSRMSFRAMSSALWSVAIETVEPAMNTGSSMANGVTAPVRPTFTSIFLRKRRLLLGRELERDRPARELAGRPEEPALGELIDLDHHAVGIELERAPLLRPFVAEVHQRVDAGAAPPVRFDGQADGAQLLQRVSVRRALRRR